MLRITDARTGESTDAFAAPRGLTRVQAHATRSDTSSLRVLLVADVLARALEIGGTPVVTVADPPAELRARALELGIRPAEAPTAPGGRTVHVLRTHATAADGRPGTVDGIHVEVAPAHGTAEPGVLRLALLARPRRDVVDVDDDTAARAGELLTRWRAAVARWATRPSRPVPEDVKRQLRTAWEDDLDVPAVLEVLHRVERADGLPDGARFETYAYADRLLGLELTRDIGTLG
ncbi:hypothetical protein ACFYP4_17725 [Streptomyces sp. NPDC005551]|uniref:hypothetical protein n=1 Tax=Streptomyces sp. NPDC005551 TaxID=3364725 RepID=UPI0036A7A2BA